MVDVRAMEITLLISSPASLPANLLYWELLLAPLAWEVSVNETWWKYVQWKPFKYLKISAVNLEQ